MHHRKWKSIESIVSIIIGVSRNIQLHAVDLYRLIIYPYNVCVFTVILPIYILSVVSATGFDTAKHSITRSCTAVIQVSSYSICTIRRCHFVNDFLPFNALNIIKSPINAITKYRDYE